jgi:hypothetical protein
MLYGVISWQKSKVPYHAKAQKSAAIPLYPPALALILAVTAAPSSTASRLSLRTYPGTQSLHCRPHLQP